VDDQNNIYSESADVLEIKNLIYEKFTGVMLQDDREELINVTRYLEKIVLQCNLDISKFSLSRKRNWRRSDDFPSGLSWKDRKRQNITILSSLGTCPVFSGAERGGTRRVEDLYKNTYALLLQESSQRVFTRE